MSSTRARRRTICMISKMMIGQLVCPLNGRVGACSKHDRNCHVKALSEMKRLSCTLEVEPDDDTATRIHMLSHENLAFPQRPPYFRGQPRCMPERQLKLRLRKIASFISVTLPSARTDDKAIEAVLATRIDAGIAALALSAGTSLSPTSVSVDYLPPNGATLRTIHPNSTDSP